MGRPAPDLIDLCQEVALNRYDPYQTIPPLNLGYGGVLIYMQETLAVWHQRRSTD